MGEVYHAYWAHIKKQLVCVFYCYKLNIYSNDKIPVSKTFANYSHQLHLDRQIPIQNYLSLLRPIYSCPLTPADDMQCKKQDCQIEHRQLQQSKCLLSDKRVDVKNDSTRVSLIMWLTPVCTRCMGSFTQSMINNELTSPSQAQPINCN